MNFEKAYAELLLGSKIRRKAWEPYMHLRILDGTIKTFKGENISFYGNANFLLNNDWTIMDGDGKKLTFIEALNALKQKQSITHSENLGFFIFVDNGELAICKEIEFDFTPTFKDLCSADWEIMK